jgi:prepilin-type N-terminal cleavage/methylation domain-containing protein
MISREHIYADQGYTLIELSIAIVLTVVVVGLVYAGYGQARSAVTSWQQSLQAKNMAYVIGRRVAQDIRSSHYAEFGPNRLRLSGNGETILYSWTRNRLQRKRLSPSYDQTRTMRPRPSSFQTLGEPVVHLRDVQLSVRKVANTLNSHTTAVFEVTFSTEVASANEPGNAPTSVPIRIVASTRPGKGKEWRSSTP